MNGGELDPGGPRAAALPEPAFHEGQRVTVNSGRINQLARRGQAATVIEVHETKFNGAFVGYLFSVRFADGGSGTFSPHELEALPALPYQD